VSGGGSQRQRRNIMGLVDVILQLVFAILNFVFFFL
jgi:hypothetical protein